LKTVTESLERDSQTERDRNDHIGRPVRTAHAVVQHCNAAITHYNAQYTETVLLLYPGLHIISYHIQTHDIKKLWEWTDYKNELRKNSSAVQKFSKKPCL